ncbi:unnamed protein product [Owenia fusiformis]|uniref:Uncharacterized protein n=1 Tax=Owenia fusiformis TaxID=6347 RepID=A0A8J1UYE0_OWEFU|nr:unnamed protein product [Owenia fusiformis]
MDLGSACVYHLRNVIGDNGMEYRTSSTANISTQPTNTTSIPTDPNANVTFGFSIVQSAFLILGIISNLTLIICLVAIKRLRTVPNIFVVNLCAAGILLSVNSFLLVVQDFTQGVNTKITLMITPESCRWLGFIDFIPPIALVMSMVIIARHRYISVLNVASDKRLFTRRRVCLMLAFVWVIAILIAVPILVGLIQLDKNVGNICACCFKMAENPAFAITVTLIVYVIPNILIIFYYTRILVFVRKSRRRIEHHTRQGNHISHNEMWLSVQFIIIFVAFNICYLPTMIVFWAMPENNPRVFTSVGNNMVRLLFTSNLLVNPLIFITFNQQARHVILSSIKTPCVRTPTTVSGSQGSHEIPLQASNEIHLRDSLENNHERRPSQLNVLNLSGHNLQQLAADMK